MVGKLPWAENYQIFSLIGSPLSMVTPAASGVHSGPDIHRRCQLSIKFRPVSGVLRSWLEGSLDREIASPGITNWRTADGS
jgi:hypothetical protein